MDKSWIGKSKTSDEFAIGFTNFLEFAYNHSAVDGKIKCPCKRCYCRFYLSREEVETHVMLHDFCPGYTVWIDHGEQITTFSFLTSSQASSCLTPPTNTSEDDIRSLIQDTFRVHSDQNARSSHGGEQAENDEAIPIDVDTSSQPANDPPHLDDAQYRSLLDDIDCELYPGCEDYSKLSFILHLLHLKYMFGWSEKSFSMLLELLVDAFHQMTSMPTTFYEAKKIMKSLGLGYKKIHACPKDCKLYWNFDEDKPTEDDTCSVCGMSRWKEEKDQNIIDQSAEAEEGVGNKQRKPKKIAAKILRYFPLKPRLKRLYSCPKTSKDMIWHEKSRTKDGKLRHPADGLAWKSFDEKYIDFAADPRNIRLGLSSDGFNPFRTLSTNHSTWPVVLFCYNLPPWLCMKRSSLIMSMIIPGEKAPGDDIDIYLQPLIVELCDLWRGVEAYDSCTGQTFNLRACLMWTISDFPAYANLSGWSTKGKFACPICRDYTDSLWLKNGRKFCYMGHRRWLDENHPYRFQALQFNGTIETRVAPTRTSGEEVLREMERTTTWRYGKTSRPMPIEVDGDFDENEGSSSQQRWKKRSIFFDLPYWKHQLLRHNLDAMHTEKNVSETLVNTFSSFDKKSKDNENARKDLVEMNIRHELHPVLGENGKVRYPPALYTMSKAEKDRFFKVLKDLKVPDGYSSNVSRCVNLKERRLMNMKSHDYHVLIQDILPIALRASMHSDILELVIQLSLFFKGVCAREIDLTEIDQLQSDVVILLCKMEKVFPPSFFTIMMHLLIHLPEEIKLGGPNTYRWMYPVERSLGDFKSDVHNRARPEACIAEGTIGKECLIYCARYFGGAETIFNRPKRNEDYNPNANEYILNTCGRPDGKPLIIHMKNQVFMAQAHRYVLLHFDLIENFRRDFLREKRSTCGRGRSNSSLEMKWLVEDFPNWFQCEVLKLSDSLMNYNLLKSLARGPDNVVKKMNGYITRGYRFRSIFHDKNRSTQNSGVSVVTTDNTRWYGKIKGIYEFDYFGAFKVVLFKCSWVDVRPNKGIKVDRNGFTMVNFSHLIHTGKHLKDDPFILASEADQVFYVVDGKDSQWCHFVMMKAKETFQLGNNHVDDEEPELECEPQAFQTNTFDDITTVTRNDMDADFM